jgi:hypothetical protein
VMPLRIIIQAKMRVTARPERGGMRMAKSPARMRRTLRAMDQPMDFGVRGEIWVDEMLMKPPRR